jgi:hypothetical protein
MATAITSAVRKRFAGFNCGESGIRVIGAETIRPLERGKLLIISRLTRISPLVTYREDGPLRYKRTVWRKTLCLWGFCPWSRAVRYKRTSRPPPGNCYFEGETFWAL